MDNVIHTPNWPLEAWWLLYVLHY